MHKAMYMQKTPSSRQKARQKALEALYSAYLKNSSIIDEFKNNNFAYDKTSKSYLYAKDIIEIVESNLVKIDEILQESVDRDIKTLSPIDISILRIAIAELYFLEINKKVVISEAQKLSDKYSALNAKKLICAVLYKVCNMMAL